jgi:hypothetical protein
MVSHKCYKASIQHNFKGENMTNVWGTPKSIAIYITLSLALILAVVGCASRTPTAEEATISRLNDRVASLEEQLTVLEKQAVAQQQMISNAQLLGPRVAALEQQSYINKRAASITGTLGTDPRDTLTAQEVQSMIDSAQRVEDMRNWDWTPND